jgi:hypothetical protein
VSSRFVSTLSLLAAGFCSAFVAVASAQNTPDYEKAPIHYSTATPQDAVQRLQARLESAAAPFAGSEREILRAVLAALEVPIASQVVVFSRTSLQRGRIRPSTPRALYFSDTVYVGWVPGGLIEVAAIDPHLGPIFYSFDPRQVKAPAARFVRDNDCLRCHGGAFVRDIPGVFVRSVVTAPNGEPLLRFGSEVIDDETPFAHRWGGWYVTGYTGTEPHRGNAFGSDSGDLNVFPVSTERPQELSRFFDTAEYLAPTSDVVALLVLEHQLTMQNALTRAALNARKMIAYQHSLQKAFGEPQTDTPAYDSVKSVFASAAEEVVDRLLFRGAASLPEGVDGHPEFRASFVESAVRTASGASLREVLARGQLFKLRCSYLIYSESFRALPAPLQSEVSRRLLAALESDSPDSRYAYLPRGERQEILRVLRETHPELRERWAGRP